MFVSENLQIVKSGVYQDPKCQDWRLGNNRFSQWEANISGLEPLRHTVVVVGFGEENGQKYWKVKNSWGENWGSSGFFKIIRNGQAHCGLGAYFSVALCRKCPKGGCEPPSISSQGSPPDSRAPPDLPDEGISAGFTTFLTTPTSGIGKISCPSCDGGGQGLQSTQCDARSCVAKDESGQEKCCPLQGNTGNKMYCPSRC